MGLWPHNKRWERITPITGLGSARGRKEERQREKGGSGGAIIRQTRSKPTLSSRRVGELKNDFIVARSPPHSLHAARRRDHCWERGKASCTLIFRPLKWMPTAVSRSADFSNTFEIPPFLRMMDLEVWPRLLFGGMSIWTTEEFKLGLTQTGLRSHKGKWP